MPDYNPPRVRIPVSHIKTYFPDAHSEGAAIHCSCGWIAQTRRCHIEDASGCDNCLKAESEFLEHVAQEGASPRVY